MIKFLLKGILRDKSRSLLPVIITSIGVMLTVVLSGYIRGVMGDLADQNARFDTGHIKVVTQPYAENIDQMPIDLALLGVDSLQSALGKSYPNTHWVKRTKFGGLMDVPDAEGNTKGQGPVIGFAIELFNATSGEIDRMNLSSSIIKGALPSKPGEALISDAFADKLGIQLGEEVTYVGSTMNGSMSFKNFIVSGTIKFGVQAMDKGAMVIDIADAQLMLDMEDGSTELLGYLDDGAYIDSNAAEVRTDFNGRMDATDEYAPVMLTLKEQNNLASYLDMVDVYAGMFVFIFVMAMSIVLWNTGLLGGLRRYQEFGIRLALGEPKGKIYRSLLSEALLIGSMGSLVGTAIGVVITLWWQKTGIDITDMLANSTMMMPNILRAKFTPDLLYIGFIPGVFAMVIGNALSGMGIYKRQTASLFKELEV